MIESTDALSTRVVNRISYGIFLVRRTRVWPRLILWKMGLHRPFDISLNGTTLRIDDEAKRIELSRWLRHLHEAWPLREVVNQDGSGLFFLRFGGKTLVFNYTNESRFGTLFVLKEFFIKEPYAGLGVQGKDVLDIGANIGDSAVYFCCKGARRVISLEPYPQFFETADANISANGFRSKVVLLNEAAGRGSKKTIDTTMKVMPWTEIKEAAAGKQINVNSLHDLIRRFDLDSAALKMNCEGCEYELLEDATAEDLAHFSQIAIEYHNGPERIEKWLHSAGFSTRMWPSPGNPSHGLLLAIHPYKGGYVLATRSEAGSEKGGK